MDASGSSERIASLDIVRGVAVMGILAMNVTAFAMPFQAYLNPLAFGMESEADYWSWALGFIFVDGKMRGLFSFLFGASTLLVIERARVTGASEASVHYRRMIWLLLFGLAHFYLVWFGDILSGYALAGLILYFFRDLSVRILVAWGIMLVLVQTILFGAMAGGTFMMEEMASRPLPDPEMLRQWQGLQRQMGIPDAAQIADKFALYRGSWAGLVEHKLTERLLEPLTAFLMFGAETIGYMLFGMAALKSGLLAGRWPGERYRRIAIIGLAIAVPAYALLAWILTRDGFSLPMVMLIGMAATAPLRPVMVLAYAALIILVTRKRGPLVGRIEAAGRAAFTNYLATSLVMTTLFYGHGLGLYGTMSRSELWLLVLPVWALMLLWSRPWLERYRYGPFEWAWRSLARWEWQKMRRDEVARTA